MEGSSPLTSSGSPARPARLPSGFSPQSTGPSRSQAASSHARRTSRGQRMRSPSASTPAPTDRRQNAYSAPEVTLLSRTTLTYDNARGELIMPSSSTVPDPSASSSPDKESMSVQWNFPVPAYLLHSKQYDCFTTSNTAPVPDFNRPPSLTEASGSRLFFNKTTSPVGNTATGKALHLPTRWDPRNCCDLLEMTASGLTVSFRGTGKNGDKDAAAVKADRSVPSQTGIYYFEVEILSKGQSGYIGVGFSAPEVSLTRLPGWEENSYGYHGDDGHSFSANGTGQTFGPTFTTGDVVGCGIDWTQNRAFFTKNGAFIDYCFSDLKSPMYPSVGLRTPGEMVKANFGQNPFRFDIEHFTTLRKAEYLDTVVFGPSSANENESSLLRKLVHGYLCFHGHASAAAAFAKEIQSNASDFRDLQSLGGTETYASDNISSEEDTYSIEKRRNIIQLIEQGEPVVALNEIQTHFPKALGSNDKSDWLSIDFQLRCRQFVELMQLAWLQDEDDEMEMETEYNEVPAHVYSKTRRREVDAIDVAVTLLQSLHQDYGHYPHPAIQTLLQKLSVLFAYPNPASIEDEQLQSLLGEGGEADRQSLARFVNGCILKSMGADSVSALERVTFHSLAVLEQLNLLGDGAAPFVNVP